MKSIQFHKRGPAEGLDKLRSKMIGMEDTKKGKQLESEEPEAGPSNLEDANGQVWSFLNKSPD